MAKKISILKKNLFKRKKSNFSSKFLFLFLSSTLLCNLDGRKFKPFSFGCGIEPRRKG